MPRTYDPEFRRRVVELVRAGRPVRSVAVELWLAEATVYRWKAQDLVDRGMKLGISTSERGELAAARRRIRELETELALVKQAAALFEEGVRPKDTYPVIAELAGQGFAAKRCCRILGQGAATRRLHLPARRDVLAVPGHRGRPVLAGLVGWSLATHLRAELVIDALDAAVTTRGRAEGVAFHADHGAQYTSAAFAQVCATHKVVQSMGRIGDSYDSAVAESVFATLKRELGGRFDSADQARLTVFSWIAFYNHRRRRSALDYHSPIEYENITTHQQPAAA